MKGRHEARGGTFRSIQLGRRPRLKILHLKIDRFVALPFVPARREGEAADAKVKVEEKAAEIKGNVEDAAAAAKKEVEDAAAKLKDKVDGTPADPSNP